MKKILILLTLILPMAVFAQEMRIEKNVYAKKMSPNGKWIGSEAGDASIYNVETGENVYYPECFLGLGNCISDNGLAVGDAADVGVLMVDGNTLYPESINNGFCDIHAVTRDGSHIVGIMANTNHDGVDFVPFIAEVDENYNVGEPTILPYPKKDFFRAAPQYVTAVYVSDDAKTVVGNVTDWRGMYTYPVYFTQDAAGEWSAFCPTESLFNPDKIDLPDNPWLGEPVFPEPENYILDPTAREAYLEAFELYSTGGGIYPYPYPEDYMTEEEYQNFANGVKEYNTWYYGQEDAIKEYIQIYAKILQTTPSFSGNDMAMNPTGEFFMQSGSIETPGGETTETGIYKFNTKDNSITTYKSPGGGFFPNEILSDGTVFMTKGMQASPTSLILLPGEEEFITPQQYFQKDFPEVSEWLDENFPYGNGVLISNEDKTFFTGALVPELVVDYDWEGDEDFYYSTYFINLPFEAGIESIVEEPEDGLYKAYNLSGLKVLETKEVSELNSLPKGIYIVNGHKVYIK